MGQVAAPGRARRFADLAFSLLAAGLGLALLVATGRHLFGAPFLERADRTLPPLTAAAVVAVPGRVTLTGAPPAVRALNVVPARPIRKRAPNPPLASTGVAGASQRSHATVGVTKAASQRPRATVGVTKAASQRPHATVGMTRAASQQPHATDRVTRAASERPHATVGVTKAAWERPHATVGVTKAASQRPHATVGVTKAASQRPQATVGVTKAASQRPHATVGVTKAASPTEKSRVKAVTRPPRPALAARPREVSGLVARRTAIPHAAIPAIGALRSHGLATPQNGVRVAGAFARGHIVRRLPTTPQPSIIEPPLGYDARPTLVLVPGAAQLELGESVFPTIRSRRRH